jgi:hypothetical protein
MGIFNWFDRDPNDPILRLRDQRPNMGYDPKKLVKCARCERPKFYEEVKYLPSKYNDLDGAGKRYWYCPECLPEAEQRLIEQSKRRCAMCGTRHGQPFTLNGKRVDDAAILWYCTHAQDQYPGFYCLGCWINRGVFDAEQARIKEIDEEKRIRAQQEEEAPLLAKEYEKMLVVRRREEDRFMRLERQDRLDAQREEDRLTRIDRQEALDQERRDRQAFFDRMKVEDRDRAIRIQDQKEQDRRIDRLDRKRVDDKREQYMDTNQQNRIEDRDARKIIDGKREAYMDTNQQHKLEDRDARKIVDARRTEIMEANNEWNIQNREYILQERAKREAELKKKLEEEMERQRLEDEQWQEKPFKI